jgi:two-component system cell cycle response regulator
MQLDSDDTTQLLVLPQRPAVLLVEDDPLASELLATLLSAEKVPFIEARSAEDALAIMQTRFFQIVITDVHMPGMDGLALCRELRAAKLPGYVYIIVMTGARANVIDALKAGADDYLDKGVSRAELMARLQTAERIVMLESRLRTMLDEQRRLAASDGLTGLPNRRAFAKQYNAEFKRAVRFHEDLAVVLLDIDYFKRINDRYGHGVGDEVLKQFAQRVSAALPRPFDFIARLGGEEFVALLPQTDLPGAVTVAERLRLAVANTPFQIGEHVVPATVSIGVSSLNERSGGDAVTPEDVLDVADQRLYASKESGRNRVTSALPSRPRSLTDVYR